MKFLILNADYHEFLNSLYGTNPGLEEKSYDEQKRVRYESLFGVVDYYSRNLHELGHEAWDIHFNNKAMQSKWAQEHGLRTGSDWRRQFRMRRGIIPWFSWVRDPKDRRWLYDILEAQIKYYKPDILLNQAIGRISCSFLKEMKPYFRLLVGQHAATQLPDKREWSCYDLITSSFPLTVEWFRQRGIPAELQRLAFEPRVLDYLNGAQQKIPVSFVGSLLSSVHSSRMHWLEKLCARLDIKVWAPSIDKLDCASPVRKSYVGHAWGRQMYEILHQSRITLNHHGNILTYANNLRLYEATGVGSFLITDWKENLYEMFTPDKEVVAYRNWEECAELIQWYLEHDEKREAIARAGQERTLRGHTFYQRMQELLDIVRHYL